MFDIIFLSYREENADENWVNLKSRFSHATRVHGVDGLLEAHKEAARKANTKMFYVIDGDNVITEKFSFSFHPDDEKGLDHTYIWRCMNPVNELVYGYGGIKLFPKRRLLNVDEFDVDMTTSISKERILMKETASVTHFNTSEFSAWKSAFRECVKLSSRTILNQKEDETKERLETWCNVGSDKPYGDYCIEGARFGKLYGESNKEYSENLSKINDFDWLRKYFDRIYDTPSYDDNTKQDK